MKKLALFFFSLFLFFLTGFAIARMQPHIKAFLSGRAVLSKPDAELVFKPAPYPINNHPFVITIIGYNNGAAVDKTIRSVLSQTYENYRVIYIDDGSNDGSFDHARDLIYDSGQGHRVHFMQNMKPVGTTANLAQAINSCDDNEIIVIVDGEDLLSHEWVLQKLNQYYANADLWMTFGSAMHYPKFTRIQNLFPPDSNLRRSALENQTLPFFHLKTFYAGLFKKINKSDLFSIGEPTPNEIDLSYMIPLLEMAESHVQSLPEVLYLATKPPKQDEALLSVYESTIGKTPSYSPLPYLFNREAL